MRTLFFFLFLILNACSKADNVNPNHEDFLLAKKWKISSVIVKDNNVTSDFFDDCELDDYWLFKNGGIFELHTAIVKCNPSELDIDTSNWALSADQAILNIGGNEFNLVSISSSSMQLQIDSIPEKILYNYQGF